MTADINNNAHRVDLDLLLQELRESGHEIEDTIETATQDDIENMLRELEG